MNIKYLHPGDHNVNSLLPGKYYKTRDLITFAKEALLKTTVVGVGTGMYLILYMASCPTDFNLSI